MIMLKRVMTYPGTILMVLSVAYAIVRVDEALRGRFLAVSLMASLGIAELVVVAAALGSRSASVRTALPRVALSAGALMLSYATLMDSHVLLSLLGTVLFASGLLPLRRSRS